MKEYKNKQKEYHGVKEIARRAGVSIATVDRVLHNRSGVSPSTKRKIERIIKELSYKPNIIASRLASTKVFCLSVLIPAISEETNFWQAPLNGIARAQERIKEFGINVKISFFDLNDRKSFVKQSNKILEDVPDGVLLAPSFLEEAKSFTKQCQKNKIPFVLIDSNIPHEENLLCYIGPHLFRSGFLGGQLINFFFRGSLELLVVNISKEVDDHSYLLEIEEGFRSYFSYHGLHPNIRKIEIKQAHFEAIKRSLDDALGNNNRPAAILVTNSRVGKVAHYFELTRKERPLLLGYDFTKENIEYLKRDLIDILICHQPEEQGYRGIMALYRHLILHQTVEQTQFMPIDIITKENYEFYHG